MMAMVLVLASCGSTKNIPYFKNSDYIDESGKFHMEDTHLTAYSHGKYYEPGKMLGSFGYSVKKKTAKKNGKHKKRKNKKS